MAEPISIQQLKDASEDAKSLEEVVNGSDTKQVTTRLGENYPSVKKAIKTLFENGSLPAAPFATKSLMTASALADGKYAMVTDDTTNNGLYVKTAGAWVKSEYDPLAQSKDYTDTAKTEAIAAASIDAENKAKSEVSKVARFDSFGNNAYLFTDKNELVLGVLNSNAEFEANDFVTPNGSLTDAIKVSEKIQTTDTALASAVVDESGTVLFGIKTNADVVSPYPPLQGFGVDAVRGKLLSNDALNTAGKYLDRAASENDKNINFEVLVAENLEDGRGHCRIGSIHQISETRFYVAYIQYAQVGGEDGGRFRAKFIDVDFDNESAVVSPVRKLPQFEGVGTEGAGNAHFMTNKDEVLMVLHQDSDLITMVSYDECMTWTEVGRYSPKPSTFWMGLDSVTKIHDGQYKDRIVVAGFISNIADAGFGLQSIYSDDFGRTWTVGYRFDPRTIGWGKNKNETSVTTDCNNDLIFIVRDETAGDPSTQKMFFGKSKDGGKTFTVFNPEKDTWAGTCPFGVAQAAPHVWDGVPKTLVTQPPRPNRLGLTLYTSYNGCASWANEFELIPASVLTGYTYINALTSKFYAIAYEHGGFNANSNISIKFINTGAIYNVANS